MKMAKQLTTQRYTNCFSWNLSKNNNTDKAIKETSKEVAQRSATLAQGFNNTAHLQCCREIPDKLHVICVT